MWHTNNGDRTLEGAEARVFAHALWDFVQELENNKGDYDVALPVFDRLTYGQKASLLSIVGRGLLKPESHIRELTAVVECAVAAVFEFLKMEVIIEIDDPDSETSWRKVILAARRQAGAEDLPDADCIDVQEWFFEIEAMAEMILWDNDYLSESDFVDDSPEDSDRLKELIGITDDYFLEIADDPKPSEIDTILSELKALCRSICDEN